MKGNKIRIRKTKVKVGIELDGTLSEDRDNFYITFKFPDKLILTELNNE